MNLLHKIQSNYWFLYYLTISPFHRWRDGRKVRRKHNKDPRYNGALKVGDLYEGCPAMPCVATLVDYTNDELEGISLTTGSPTNCSLKHCAPVRLTPEQVGEILRCKHDLDPWGHCMTCKQLIKHRTPTEEEKLQWQDMHPESYYIQ